MKKLLTGVLLLFLISSFAILQNTVNTDDITGTWLSQKKDGKIEIYKSGNEYAGKLVWASKMYEPDGITSKKDKNNPNEQLRSRNLKDLPMLSGFVFKNGTWTDGRIYDPESGKTYRSIIKLTNNKLNIRGYIGISLFGRTTEWTRVR